MHSIGIIHGDIKGGNVLVSLDRTVMLADLDGVEPGGHFSGSADKADGQGISLRWAAPELLVGDGCPKTYKSDVYALGMTTLEVLTDKLPYSKTKNAAQIAQLIFRGVHPQRPEKMPDIQWRFLTQCWSYTPATRPDARDAASHLKLLTPHRRSAFRPCCGTSRCTNADLDRFRRYFKLCHRPDPEVLTIGRHMCPPVVALHLGDHGCQDISETIDTPTFGAFPFFYGGSGDVYRGKLLDSTKVCVKVPRFESGPSRTLESQVYASREIHTWNKCRHPNILPLLGLAVFRDRVAMVSPWVKNGTLRQFLETHKEADRCQLSTQICDAVAYLHSIDVIHTDIKGDNVLISDDGNALLADFGGAELTDRTIKFTQIMDQCGWTTRWGAPEILYETVDRSKPADVYALGMTILEAITGEVPFSNKAERAMFIVVCLKRQIPFRPTADIPENSIHGDRLWDILRKCWSYEPEKRPSATEVGSIMRTITKEGLASNDLESESSPTAAHILL